MKKRIFTLILCLCLPVLAGCSNTASPSSQDENFTRVLVSSSQQEESSAGESSSEKTSSGKYLPGEDLTAEEKVFAGKIIAAVQAKDLNALADLTAYPVYIGIGEGKTVASKEEMTALGADQIFTDALTSTISSINPDSLRRVEAGIVMGESRPNIIFHTDENGSHGIAGINY